MRRVFADSVYWAALLDRRDRWHRQAQVASARLTDARLVTTEEVLAEVLTLFASPPRRARRREAIEAVRDILSDPSIEVLPQTHDSFIAGLALFIDRPDREYSLTDCISMQTMRELGITEVLTHDHHFEQEGFLLLLRE